MSRIKVTLFRSIPVYKSDAWGHGVGLRVSGGWNCTEERGADSPTATTNQQKDEMSPSTKESAMNQAALDCQPPD